MTSTARIEELREKFDENPRRYFAPLANEYRKAGDLAQAVEICRAHLAQQPGHMSGHIVLGQALYESGEMDEAQQVFHTALELDPENLIALRYLGDAARNRNDLSAARSWYQRVLDADPRNPEITQRLDSLSSRASSSPRAQPPQPASNHAEHHDPPAIALLELTSAEIVVSGGDMIMDIETVVFEQTGGVQAEPEVERSSEAAEPEPEPELESEQEQALAQGEANEAELAAGKNSENESPASPDSPDERQQPTASDLTTAELFANEVVLPPLTDEMLSFDASVASNIEADPFMDEALFGSDGMLGASKPSDNAAEWDDADQGSAGDFETLDLSLGGDEPSSDTTGESGSDEFALAGSDESSAESEMFDAGDLVESDSQGAEDESADESVAAQEPSTDDAAAAPEPVSDDAQAPVIDPRASMRRTPVSTPSVGQPASAFVTETMAELYLQQGFRQEALGVYRQLLEQNPADGELQSRIDEISEAEERPPAQAGLGGTDEQNAFVGGRGEKAEGGSALAWLKQLAHGSVKKSVPAEGEAGGDAQPGREPPTPQTAVADVEADDESHSLDSLFEQAPRAASPTPSRAHSFSFEQFFQDPQTEAKDPQRPSPAAPSDDAAADLDEFNAWLSGLKKQ